MAKSQDKISKKRIKEIEEQLKKYYGATAQKVIKDFESTYNKLLAQQANGTEPTPADLYKLDKYWEMQAQMRQELNKLGEKQVAALTKQFEIQFAEVYNSIAIAGANAFSTIDKSAANQLINQIWCADGKSWSQRIWKNTELLAEKLNENLVNIVVSGSKNSDLLRILQDEFNVSFSRADALVRTEVAHIQTQAAQQRYKDYGIAQVEVWVDEDERTCPICAQHEGERYSVNDRMPVPFHPRCRCCMVPVVDKESEKVMNIEVDENKLQKRATNKTNKPTTQDDAYTSAPLRKQIKEASAQEGEFNYYTHHCSACGGYFNSKIKNKKKCPLCGSDMVYAHPNAPTEHTISTKKCSHCGDLFTPSDASQNLCDKCRVEMISSKEGIKLKKHGYTDKGVIKKMTGEPDYYGREHKSSFDMYWDYTKKHPEQKAEIDALPYNERDKHFFVCIDCGDVVYKKNIKDNASKRCPECQAKHRKLSKAMAERKRRANKKTK